MSKRNLGEKIKLSTYDDMFGMEKGVETTHNEQICAVSLADLHPFANHPFKVVDDEKMEEMVESIRQYGILVPAIARARKNGGYELISGHRRHHAAKKAGLETMPVIIQECSNDQAVLIMVDANLQREGISISEKAKAYRMKYDALKHQGVAGKSSLKAMSEAAGESGKTIQRLIYLSHLTDELLACIDEKKIGIMQGVDLSFITKAEQKIVYDVMVEQNQFINMEQAARIKNASDQGLFSEEWFREILSYKKGKARKVVFIKYSLNNFELDLNISKKTAGALLKELENIGLIDMVKQTGIANVIYVKNYTRRI